MRRVVVCLVLLLSFSLSACTSEKEDMQTVVAETTVEDTTSETQVYEASFENEYAIEHPTLGANDVLITDVPTDVPPYSYYPLYDEDKNVVTMGDITFQLDDGMVTNAETIGEDGGDFLIYGDNLDDCWSIRITDYDWSEIGKHLDWTGCNILLALGELSTGEDFYNLTSVELSDMQAICSDVQKSDNSYAVGSFMPEGHDKYGTYAVRILPSSNMNREDDGSTTEWKCILVEINCFGARLYDSINKPNTFVPENVYNSILGAITEKYVVVFPSWQECFDKWEAEKL